MSWWLEDTFISRAWALAAGSSLVIPLISYLLIRKLLFNHASSEAGLSFTLPPPEQALPHWKGRRLSPVSLEDPSDPSKIQSYCPATGQFLGTVSSSTRQDIDEAIETAKTAQISWAKSSFSQRRKVLNTIGEFIWKHQEDCARVACRDSGKTMLDASLGEIMVTLEKIKWICKYGEKSVQTSKRSSPTNILLMNTSAKITYEPLGVVAAMVSWNYPLHNLMGPVVAALFTGNAIVVKCSESVIWSSTYFAEIARNALIVNGFEPDLVQIVACWPKDADYLTSHPGISHITFIGSRPVAEKVLVAASKSMTPVVVELGGKDPFVVLDDVSDIDNVASYILRGTFQSSGQNCIGIERVIALPKSYDKLSTILSSRIAQIRLGSSIDQQEDIDMGAIITDARFSVLESLIASAVADGAKLVYGGTRYVHPKYPQGHYFLPTLLTGVTTDMEIAQKEVFGPILLLFKADSLDHAIEISNSTEYGLGAAIFGHNKRDLDRFVTEIKSGNVAVNDFAMFYMCQLPFGGVKGSGYGKFGGAEGLRGLCLAKSVSSTKLSFAQNKIPRALDYPIPDAKRAWLISKSINIVGYGSGVWKRLRAFKDLAFNS